ncbi:MAG: histidine kinase dimerization/phosphoacceptor domain -containing protein, partial [Balneolales bacterium]
WWNNQLEYYTGYSYEELGELRFLDLVDEQEKQIVHEKIDEAYKTGKADIEIRLKGKEEETKLFLLTWVAVEMDNTDYIIATGLDITNKEQERRKKLRYFRVLENSQNEIIMFDADTLNLVYVNKGARDNLGYSHEKLKSMPAYQIQPGFDEESFRRHVRPLVEGRKNKLMYETYHQRSDGSTYDVEEHLQLLESNGEKLLVSIVIDITDRKDREKQIKNSLHEKDLLLGEVHHRVKNNLAIVSSLLNLQASNAENETLKIQFKESESRIKAMAMIHQMLYEQENFSEIDFGLYLKKLIKYVENNYKGNTFVKTEVQAAGISYNISTAVPCALIVNELITNAYKHACDGKMDCLIKVSLTQKDNVNTLIVSDNGSGLPSEFSLAKSNSLGMTLVKGLTDQLKGDLKVRQEGNTAFIVTFETEET